MKADKEIIMNSISNLGFEVFRNGQFHWNSSNTPDMVINDNGTIHCWTSSPFKNNTSNHGDLIDFLQVVNHNQNFKDAKEDAERLTGLKLPKSGDRYEVTLPEGFGVNSLYDYKTESYKKTPSINRFPNKTISINEWYDTPFLKFKLVRNVFPREVEVDNVVVNLSTIDQTVNDINSSLSVDFNVSRGL
jgi:hypothetical protein